LDRLSPADARTELGGSTTFVLETRQLRSAHRPGAFDFPRKSKPETAVSRDFSLIFSSALIFFDFRKGGKPSRVRHLIAKIKRAAV
jgi:hypothetical protein